MSRIAIRRDGVRVQLRNYITGRVYDMTWSLALGLSDAIRVCRKKSLLGESFTVSHKRICVMSAADGVVVAFDGMVDLCLPHSIANRVYRGLRSQSKLAEEDAKAQQVIADQALLCRKGMPFGITVDRKKLDRAFTESQWLRTPMGIGGIPTVSKVGAPCLLQHPPKGRRL